MLNFFHQKAVSVICMLLEFFASKTCILVYFTYSVTSVQYSVISANIRI